MFLRRKCHSRHCHSIDGQPFERVACGVYQVEKGALKACTKKSQNKLLLELSQRSRDINLKI